MVEHAAVNRRVVGSSPTRGARKPTLFGESVFFFWGEEMSYFLYILRSQAHNRYYTGSSQNPDNRLTYHNSTETGFTSRYRP